MGWLDKIKSILTEDRKETKDETPKKTVDFKDIPLLLEEKTTKVSKKEGEIKSRIINRIKDLEDKLNDGVNVLSNVDLSKRKEDERLKLVTKGNSNLYASLALRLSSKLKELSANTNIKTIALLEEIKKNLNEFYRTSLNPYQKGTILIGKEMDNVKRTIKEFSDEITSIEKENEPFFKELESINTLKDNFSKLEELEKQEEEIISLSEGQKKKILSIKDKCDEIEKEIINLRKSKDYEKDTKEREKRDKDKKETEKNIHELKNEINFKELKNRYHTLEDKYEIIRKYSHNFISALMEDKEFEFGKMLLDENQRTRLKDLRDKLIESSQDFPTENEDKIKSSEVLQKNAENELKTVESYIEALNKKMDKLVSRRDSLREEIIRLAH